MVSQTLKTLIALILLFLPLSGCQNPQKAQGKLRVVLKGGSAKTTQTAAVRDTLTEKPVTPEAQAAIEKVLSRVKSTEEPFDQANLLLRDLAAELSAEQLLGVSEVELLFAIAARLVESSKDSLQPRSAQLIEELRKTLAAYELPEAVLFSAYVQGFLKAQPQSVADIRRVLDGSPFARASQADHDERVLSYIKLNASKGNYPTPEVVLSNPQGTENTASGVLSQISLMNLEGLGAEVSVYEEGRIEQDSRFRLVGLDLQNTSAFDHESEPQVRLIFRIRIGSETLELPAVFTITDVDEPPAELSFTPQEVPEEQAPVALTLSSIDPEGKQVTFSLAPGPGGEDNAKFRILGSSLLLNQAVSFESQATLAVRIAHTDGTHTQETPITVSVQNINEPPADFTLSNITVGENRGSGTVVGSFAGGDPDGDRISFRLESGAGDDHNGWFTISGVELQLARTIDYESTSLLSVRVAASDGTLNRVKTFLISVQDENELHSATTLSSLSVEENRPPGAIVGTLSSSDPEGRPLVHTLVNGAGSDDNALFSISGNNLVTATVLNHETKSVVSIRVSTSDGELSREQAFQLTVPDRTPPALSSFEVFDPDSGSRAFSNSTVVMARATSSSSDVMGTCFATQATPPLATNPCFAAAAERTFDIGAGSTGVQTVYAWAVDDAGNVSNTRSAQISIQSYVDFAGVSAATVEDMGARHLKVTWTPVNNPLGFDTYEIFQSSQPQESAFNFSAPVATYSGLAAATTTQQIFSDLPDGVQHCYRVRATNTSIPFTETNSAVSCATTLSISTPAIEPPRSDSFWQQAAAYYNAHPGNIVPGEIAPYLGNTASVFNRGNVQDFLAATEVRWATDLVEASDGTLYFLDYAGHCLKAAHPMTKKVTVVAGQCGKLGFAGDGGSALNALFQWPFSIAIDRNDDVYIADNGNFRIRKLDVSAGTISTVIGNGTSGSSGDGGLASSPAANLSLATAIVFDTANNLYFSDAQNCTIRRIDAGTGVVTRYAGTVGSCGHSGMGGDADQAQIDTVLSTAFDDTTGELYLGDIIGRILRITDATETIVRIGGSAAAATGHTGDGGPALSALFTRIDGLAISGSDLYLTDGVRHSVRVIDLTTGLVSRLLGDSSGNVKRVVHGESFATNQGLQRPFRLRTSASVSDSLLLSTRDTGEILRLNLISRTIEKVAGDGSSYAGGSGTRSDHGVMQASALATDSVGNVYVTASRQRCTFKINSATDATSTVAGRCGVEPTATSSSGPAADIPAVWSSASAMTSDTDLFILDQALCTIFRVDLVAKTYSVRAGQLNVSAPNCSYTTTASATNSSPLYYATTIAASPNGKYLYVADYSGHVVRRLVLDPADPNFNRYEDVWRNTTGCSTITGTTTSVDGCSTTGITFDPAGNMYAVSRGYIRKVDTNGVTTHLAGNGSTTPISVTQSSNPTSVSVGSPAAVVWWNNSLYFASELAHTVYALNLTTSELTLIAGLPGIPGHDGDGAAASSAKLNGPFRLAIDGNNNLLVSTVGGGVRAIKLSAP